jgi:hypothetical protein
MVEEVIKILKDIELKDLLNIETPKVFKLKYGKLFICKDLLVVYENDKCTLAMFKEDFKEKYHE